MTIDSSDKDAYTEATIAEDLRTNITGYTASAVAGGVDRDWANSWLVRLGAQPVTGNATYRMNVPVTGVYGKTVIANSRAEAAQKFLEHVQRVAQAGQVTDHGECDAVYEVKFQEPVTAADVTFFEGPEDPEPSNDPAPGLDALKDGIRKMLMEGVTEQGWSYPRAKRAIAEMGLDALPAILYRSVQVPVSGTHQLTVRVFEGADEETLYRATASHIRRSGLITISPEEMGATVSVPVEDVEF